jgi:HrpA-like RNA helicase
VTTTIKTILQIHLCEEQGHILAFLPGQKVQGNNILKQKIMFRHLQEVQMVCREINRIKNHLTPDKRKLSCFPLGSWMSSTAQKSSLSKCLDTNGNWNP